MIQQLLPCVIAMMGAVSVAAQTLQAPAAAGTPGATVGQPVPFNTMPGGFSPPQADEATVRRVWEAVVERFPEIVDGPERQGTFVVALALWPDGRVVRSEMRHVGTRAEANPSQQALRDLLPMDARGIPLGIGIQRKGATVLGDRILKGEVMLNGVIVPSNWDETRDRGVVHRAVLQHHADLFLPMSADHVNLLTVVMSDNGGIAGSRVEVVPVQHQGSMTTSMRTMMARTSAVATDFTTLGLDPDDVGVMGDLSLSTPLTAAGTAAQLAQLAGAVGADGIARGSSHFRDDTPHLLVRYAWPRRPGEPVGGAALAWDSIPRQDRPPSPMMQAGQLARQYFPPGSAAEGNWMLLTFNGEVLRTGHVELEKGESLTPTYVERLMPGIKVTGVSIMRHHPTPGPGEPPGSPISINAFFLAQDSPLPPAENIQVPAR